MNLISGEYRRFINVLIIPSFNMCPYGAKEFEISKFKKFLKQIGIDHHIFATGGNERCVKYKGKLIFFSLIHGDRLIKEPYINEIIIQKLHLDELSENDPRFAIEFNNLKKLARQVIHY